MRKQQPSRRAFFEPLEDRRVLATLSALGTTLTITLDNANEVLGVGSNGSSYSLASTGGFVDGGVMAGHVTGFGSNSASVTAVGLAAYNTIHIVDGAGAQGTRVTFFGGTFSDYFMVGLNQDADVGPGEQSVVFDGDSNFGVFGITISTTRNIVVNRNVTASSTEIILQANPTGTTTGNFVGIAINSPSQISGGSAGPAVTINGKGGNTGTDNHGVRVSGTSALITSSGGTVEVTGVSRAGGTGGNNYGVYVASGGRITSGGTGSVTVQGTGGNAIGNNNHGVRIENSNSRITSGAGAVHVIGQGGGAGTSTDNYGISVYLSGQIAAGGSGTVTVDGTGGTGAGARNAGIRLEGAGSITSGGGTVHVAGQGGTGISGSNYGVWATGGQITAGSGGAVTVQGIGGSSNGLQNTGVLLNGFGSNIASSGGNVSVTGQGGGTASGTANDGIVVRGEAQLRAGGSGTVTVHGTGGNGSGGHNNGVIVNDPSSIITSAGGAVQVTGVGGVAAFSANNLGVYVGAGSQITAGGSATVTIQGTGGTSSDGVTVQGTGGIITSSGGVVQVTGQGGSGASGVNVLASGQIRSGGTGVVTVVGTGDGGGVRVASSITSNGGAVQVTGQGGTGVYVFSTGLISAGGSGTVTVNGTGGGSTILGGNRGVVIEGAITSGGGDVQIVGQGGGSGAGGYNYGVWVTGQVTAGGMGSVTIAGIGGSGSSGSNSGVWVIFGSIRSSGGPVHVIGEANPGNNNYGVLVAGQFGGSGGRITAGGSGSVTVEGRGGSSGVRLEETGAITSAGGNVQVTGNGTSSGGTGVFVHSGSQITAGGSGTVAVVGTGGSGFAQSHGVWINGTNSVITSNNGPVQLNGQGGASGTNNFGVYVASGGRIMAGGLNTVTVQGSGGASNDTGALGVYVENTGSTITSAGGNVQVIGQGGTGTGSHKSGVAISGGGQITAAGNGNVIVQGVGGINSVFDFNYGVLVDVGSRVTSGGGAVTVEGTGGGDGIQNHGVWVNGPDSMISSGGGPVQVTGTQGNGSNQSGITVGSGGAISTTLNGGAITLIGDSQSFDFTDAVNAGTNVVTLRPKTDIGIGLGVADAAGTLGLTDAELDRITAGTLIVGHTASGTVAVLSAITRTSSTNLQLIGGGNILFNGGTLNTAGGSLILSPGSAGSVQPITSGTEANIGSAALGFASGADLAIVIDGTAVDTQYRQLNVVGTVNLTGVDLALNGVHSPSPGQSFVIVNNDDNDPIVGTFNGLAQGAIIANFLGSGLNATISYSGGLNNNDVVLTVVPDYDGVPANVEDGNPNGTDGNGDGTPDSQQDNVTSLPNSADGGYVTLVTPVGTNLAQVSAVANPSPGNTPSGVTFPVGFLDFGIQGIVNGAVTTVTMMLPVGITANTYYKYGPTSGNATPHWYEFLYDGTTGAETTAQNPLIPSNQIVLHFRDGLRGDDDLLANGSIVDPGSPGVKLVTTELTLNSGNLMITDIAIGGQIDSLTIQSDTANGKFVVSDPNHVLGVTQIAGAVVREDLHSVEVPFAAVTGSQIIVNTLAGDDNLIVDFALGSFSKTITYDGGPQSVSDRLTLTGGGTFAAVTHNFLNATAGTIDVTGNSSIAYTGLEPITDNLGAIDRVFTFNGGTETITLTDAAGANMTIDSSVGESVTFANPTGSLTINAGTGDDTVTVASVDAGYNRQLTINGNGGSDTINLDTDMTFSTDNNLDVDLTDDAALGDADRINVGVNANLIVLGVGAITFKASRNIALASGSSLVTGTGAITLSANQQTTPTIGNFAGIDINHAAVSSTGGNVTLQGRGGNVSGNNVGVRLLTGATITGGVAGTMVNINGTGGAAPTNNNWGVTVSGTGTEITSVGGAVQVVGQGGGSGNQAFNYGVNVENGGQVTAGSAGTVLVSGTGGAVEQNFNFGVRVSGSTSKITSGAGAVQVIGLGGGTGNSFFNYGVDVENGGQITAGSTGTVNVTGTGGVGPNIFHYGVFVSGAGSSITSGGGPVQVTATGAGPSLAVIVESAGAITTATNGGVLAIIGDSMSFDGTSVISTNSASTVTLRPKTDGIVINLGGADAAGTLGLTDAELDRITAGTIQIGNTNSGNMLITAAIAHSTSSNFALTSGTAIVLNTNISSLSTGGGALLLTTPGTVQPSSHGIDVTTSATSAVSFSPGATLNIAINGTSPDTQYRQLNIAGLVNLTGVNLSLLGSYVPTASDTFIIVNNDGSDPVVGTFNGLPEGTLVNVRGVNKRITYVGGTGNDVVLAELLAETEVDVSGGNLIVTDANGGTSDDTLTISINGTNVRVADPNLSLKAGSGATQVNTNTVDVPLASITGNIQVNTLGGNDSLTIDFAGGNFSNAIHYDGGAQSSTPGDSLILIGGTFATGTFAFTSDSAGTVELTGNSQISYTGLEPIVTTGATINDMIFTFNGGAETITLTDAAGAAMRIDSTSGESVTFTNPTGSLTVNAGTGDDTVNISSADAAYNVDLMINGDDGVDTVNFTFSQITFAAGENVVVTTDYISMAPNTLLATTGSGSIHFVADRAIAIDRATLSTVDGDILLQANSSGTAPGNMQAVSLGAATVTSSGSGNITLDGTAGNDPSFPQRGVVLAYGSSVTGGSSGTVSLLGTGRDDGVLLVAQGSVGSAGANVVVVGNSVSLRDTGAISPSGSGNVTVTTDGLAIEPLASINAASNTVTIAPRTSGTAINLGDADSAGTLGLTDAELDRITAGTLRIGDTRSGAITISTAIAHSTSSNFGLTSESNIIFNPGSLDTGGGTLMLQPGTAAGVQPISSGTDVTTSVTSALSFAPGTHLTIAINGANVDTQHGQLNVAGLINLSGVDLVLSGSHIPVTGNMFTIVDNDGTDGITGTFNGLPEGAVFAFNSVELVITYVGGTGNDVVLELANAPPKVNDQSFNLEENSADGSVVGTVVATDADLPADTLNYSITAGNTGGAFNIDSSTGEITVNNTAAVDFETNRVFNLTVEVEDSFGETDVATVTVNLSDLQSTLSISDAIVIEGDSGTVQLVFRVILNHAVNHAFSINFSTANGTAGDGTGGSDTDYAAASGILSFPGISASETNLVAVNVNPDDLVEIDETMALLLSGLAGTNDVSLADGLGTGTIENDDAAPVANAGGSYVIAEGGGLSLDASDTTDADSALLTYRWDVDGDGDFDENVTGETPTLTPAQMASLDLNDGPYSRTITVEASDGTNRDIATTTLIINNVDPAVVLNSVVTINENGIATLTGTITDPGTSDAFSLDIDWGDPLSPNNLQQFTVAAGATGSQSFTLTHQYLDDNPRGTASDSYTIGVTVMDDDAGVDSAIATLLVQNVAPVIVGSINGPATAVPGQSVTYSAAFTDVGKLDGHTVTINWGDGNITAGTVTETIGTGLGIAAGSHTYAGHGSYTITFALADDDQGITAKSVSLVANQSIFVLDPTAAGAFSASGNSTLNVAGIVVVDSNSTTAIRATGNARLTASNFTVVGGIQTTSNAQLIGPVTHAFVADPLAGLASPALGTVQAAVSVSGSSSRVINPGTYSSISISGNGRLTLNPGVYILAGGGFSVSGNGSVTGNGVSIVNTASASGSTGAISLSGNGSFSLTPMNSGPLTGIVIFQTLNNTKALSISGNAAAGLNGTIYAPQAPLSISGNGQLDQTIIIDRFSLSGNGSSLVTAEAANPSVPGNIPNSQLLSGGFLVSVDYSSAAADTPEHNARFLDVVATINTALGEYGISLVVADAGMFSVGIRVHVAETSPGGGAAQGVLGYALAGGDVFVISGWNWYTGADAAAVGAQQYDYQTVLTHELGHAVGLQHSSDTSSVMYASLATGVARRGLTTYDLSQLTSGGHRDADQEDESDGHALLSDVVLRTEFSPEEGETVSVMPGLGLQDQLNPSRVFGTTSAVAYGHSFPAAYVPAIDVSRLAIVLGQVEIAFLWSTDQVDRRKSAVVDRSSGLYAFSHSDSLLAPVSNARPTRDGGELGQQRDRILHEGDRVRNTHGEMRVRAKSISLQAAMEVFSEWDESSLPLLRIPDHLQAMRSFPSAGMLADVRERAIDAMFTDASEVGQRAAFTYDDDTISADGPWESPGLACAAIMSGLLGLAANEYGQRAAQSLEMVQHHVKKSSSSSRTGNRSKSSPGLPVD